MNAKHTPTPWRMVRAAGKSNVWIEDENGNLIAEVIGKYGYNHKVGPNGITGEISMANARMITNSVNSHEALLEALRFCAKPQGAFSRDPNEHARNCLEEVIEVAKKAIAQAEVRP